MYTVRAGNKVDTPSGSLDNASPHPCKKKTPPNDDRVWVGGDASLFSLGTVGRRAELVDERPGLKKQ